MKKQGFALIELLIVLLILILAFGFIILSLAKANIYYTEADVLKKLQVENPSIEKIVDSTRNCVAYSEILVVDKQGNKTTYLLDTNILFNYKLKPKQ
jgi:competence protein ComGC